RTGGDVGPALGAARLAQIALNPDVPLAELLPALPLEQTHLPNTLRHQYYATRRAIFKKLYQQLLPLCECE
ncbi:xylulokinase, partial [Yersinia enterocolitica]|nr:xylulokinase [Yersinia enterocolitica]